MQGADESDLADTVFTVFVRVDASAEIGTGHVMRCMALCDALLLRNIRSVFLCRHTTDAIAEMLLDRGHGVVRMTDAGPAPDPSAGLYGQWLGTTEDHDAAATIDCLLGAAREHVLCILVDHYGLGEGWEARVAAATGAAVVAIDDLDRQHAARLIVDAGIDKTPSNYRVTSADDRRLLLGPRYALLRPDFARERPASLERHRERAVARRLPRSVLVAMGGGDPHDVTGSLVQALDIWAAGRSLRIHALVGAAYPHFERLEKMSGDRHRLVLHRNASDVARLMSSIDICIGATGTSTWERCCLGLPTLSIVTAANQNELATAVSRAGIVASGGSLEVSPGDPGIRIRDLRVEDWVSEVFEPFFFDIDLQARLSRSAAEIVDGFGVLRILREMFDLVLPELPVRLSPLTTSDAQITFDWQFFPGQRKHFRSQTPPSWEQHCAWIERAVHDDDRLIRLIRLGGIPAGVIRLDPTALSRRLWPGTEAREVSIIVAPELHGRGVATRALRLLLETAPGHPVVAEVATENTASARLFRKCGFAEQDHGLFVLER
jgi:UDP-2,4-diacetamido-2,4,6-trideoxy-beta-L-altropyranose hydrolase